MRLVLAAACGAAGAPALAHGQSTASGGGTGGGATPADTLPFRRGQWAAQFRLGSDAFGLGALRFRSRSSAWVLDGGSSRSEQRTNGGIAVADDRATITSANVRAGIRAYRPVVPRVARYLGAGVTAGYTRSVQRRSDPTFQSFTQWQAGGGVYAELGAAYFVTPQLSLGAATQANVSLAGGQVRSSSAGGRSHASTTGWAATVGGVNVLGTLYF